MAKLKETVVLLILAGIAVLTTMTLSASASDKPSYEKMRWDPLHFKPAIDSATDEQCLTCHKEVLEDKVREKSPAGTPSKDAKAWYQQLDIYQGEQDTFHRRHQTSPLAKQLMNLKCNTCHQGNDPREEAPGAPVKNAENAFTLRKMVNVETTCLKCHGQMDYKRMGLPGPWADIGKGFNNNCLLCHANIRTVRHQVNYLNAEAIEKAGATNGNVCYGCHGGRAWYRISYPYPRHAWPNMPPDIPDWAKNRPKESESRFLLPSTAAK